jgi:DNA-directed RNA polymerase specialized sigma24 family protein
MGHAPSRKWSLTAEAFDGLLSLLGTERDRAAEQYLDLRRNLVRLFEWRGSSAPDEDADETINRCAKRIAEGEEIRDVATYCIGIARMLVREANRNRARAPLPLDKAPEPQTPPAVPDGESEARLQCLRRCLGELFPADRELILEYYEGDRGKKIQSRKGLTAAFGVPAGALRMRALRVRQKLQLCLEGCLHAP